MAVGEALYATASLLNHSCRANTTLRHVGRTLELRAAASLSKGEEVLTCYGPQAGFVPRHARRALLRSLYHFECECVACEGEAKQADDEEAQEEEEAQGRAQPQRGQGAAAGAARQAAAKDAR